MALLRRIVFLSGCSQRRIGQCETESISWRLCTFPTSFPPFFLRKLYCTSGVVWTTTCLHSQCSNQFNGFVYVPQFVIYLHIWMNMHLFITVLASESTAMREYVIQFLQLMDLCFRFFHCFQWLRLLGVRKHIQMIEACSSSCQKLFLRNWVHPESKDD